MNHTFYSIGRLVPNRYSNDPFIPQVLHPNELTQTPVGASLVEYSSLVPHLRMATNYTMTVTALTHAGDAVASEDPPASADEGRRTSNARGRAIPDARGTAQVFIQTKGCEYLRVRGKGLPARSRAEKP